MTHHDPTEPIDTGVLAEVPEDERLSDDQGDGANALEGGDDTELLDAVYADPGEIIEEGLG